MGHQINKRHLQQWLTHPVTEGPSHPTSYSGSERALDRVWCLLSKAQALHLLLQSGRANRKSRGPADHSASAGCSPVVAAWPEAAHLLLGWRLSFTCGAGHHEAPMFRNCYRIGPAAVFFYSPLFQKEEETYNPQLHILINSCVSVSKKTFAFFQGRCKWDVGTDAHVRHAQRSLNYLY